MQQRYVANVVSQVEIDAKEKRLAKVLVDWEKLRRIGKLYPLLSSPPMLFRVMSLVDPWGNSKERITIEELERDVEKAKGELLG